jgi:hypothetical protein
VRHHADTSVFLAMAGTIERRKRSSPRAGVEAVAGRHVRTDLGLEDEVGPLLHDVSTCGRKAPRLMSRSELASEAKALRGVERAAARLRITTDRKLGEATRSG